MLPEDVALSEELDALEELPESAVALLPEFCPELLLPLVPDEGVVLDEPLCEPLCRCVSTFPVAPAAPDPEALPDPEIEPLWLPCELWLCDPCEPCEPWFCELEESLVLLDVLELLLLGEGEELPLDGWLKLPLPDTDDEEEP